MLSQSGLSCDFPGLALNLAHMVLPDSLADKRVISTVSYHLWIALQKAQVALQLGKIFSLDNGVLVSIMFSYTY